jgi:hypothetical protein
MVSEAKAQLLEYRDWFEDKRNRQSLRDRFGLEIYRPRLGLVIGSGPSLVSSYEHQKLRSREPDVEIVTYDEILKHAQRRLMLVRSASRQR